MGRYADAERIFEAEFKNQSTKSASRMGLEISTDSAIIIQPGFEQAIDSLYQENPNDAYVNLFLGEFYAANDQPDKAIQHYNQAIEQNTKLAEAHYDLSRLYNQQGNLGAAKVESLKAIDISPTPKYRNNLATIYFKQQNTKKPLGNMAGIKNTRCPRLRARGFTGGLNI